MEGGYKSAPFPCSKSKIMVPDPRSIHWKNCLHLFCMMWITGWLWSQCKGNCPHLNLILGTPSNFTFLSCPSYLDRFLTSMNKLEFRMDIPAVTREYTPGSCRNSRKHMRLSLPLEMRPDSSALCPEQLRFPNQTHKEPWFPWWNSRESLTTLSQDEKNTDVTPGMQNCSVYPKSNWDEANFPCIGSITTPRSTSYRTSGLTPNRNLERFLETAISSIENHQFQ